MNYFILLFFIISTDRIIPLDANLARLTALNNSPHVLQLYQQLRNEDIPLKTDPATGNAEIRRQICEDLVCNRFFYRTSLELLQAIAIHRDLKHPRFHDIFPLVYNLKNNKYQYTNSYRKLEFIQDDFRFKEHVFFCPVRDLSDDEEATYHFYVSKEYNVGPFDESYMPGRFMIGYPEVDGVDQVEMILAEEPARTYNKAGFNVELFYLRLRQHIEPAKLDISDPVCKLISSQLGDPNNQHFRLCVAALRSSYFKDKVHYPENLTFSCHEEIVSFRSVEALEEADDEESFKELMTLCYSEYLDPPNVSCKLYISRAYLSNSIFVYRQDPQDSKIYLENLSTNVGIVDELNTFNLVEY